MLEYQFKNEGSDEDLDSYREVKPLLEKFKTLTVTKLKGEVGAYTRIEFENTTLHFKALNIGYSGSGPRCLVQILVEIGFNKELAEKAVFSQKDSLHAQRVSIFRMGAGAGSPVYEEREYIVFLETRYPEINLLPE